MFETGLSGYDFLGASEAYKLGWSDYSVQRYNSFVFSYSFKGRLAAIKSAAREALATNDN
jgi:CelD/BcsL family acetyltransferase involved in cellulose biosynthesis